MNFCQLSKAESFVILSDMTSNELNNATCHVYLNTLIPTVDTTVAQFQGAEASWTGYAAFTPVWGTAINDVAGNGQVNLPATSKEYSLGAGVSQTPVQVASGYWLQNSAGTAVIGFGALPFPQSIGATGDGFTFQPAIPFPLVADSSPDD